MLEKLGMVLRKTGKLENAETIFKRLLEWRDAAKDKFGGSVTLRELALVYLAKNDKATALADKATALAYANLSYDLAKDINNSILQGFASRILGDVYLASDDLQQSIKSYEEAYKTFIEIESKHEAQKTGETLIILLDELKKFRSDFNMGTPITWDMLE